MTYQFKTLEQQRAETTARALAIAGEWVAPGQKSAPKPGVLVETITRCDETGRKTRTYKGDKRVWMDPFKLPAQIQVDIPVTNETKQFLFYLDGGKRV